MVFLFFSVLLFIDILTVQSSTQYRLRMYYPFDNEKKKNLNLIHSNTERCVFSIFENHFFFIVHKIIDVKSFFVL